jgi:hypothetical protein
LPSPAAWRVEEIENLLLRLQCSAKIRTFNADNLYAECIYAECIYAECIYAECLNTACLNAEYFHTECIYAECRCAVCWSIFTQSVFMLSVIVLCVVMLSVMAPLLTGHSDRKNSGKNCRKGVSDFGGKFKFQMRLKHEMPYKSRLILKKNFYFFGQNHRHLNNIDCLMACTACLVCFSSSVNGRSKRKRKEAY